MCTFRTLTAIKSATNLSDMESLFDSFIDNNLDFVNSITPYNSTILNDDEWNNPIYDDYLLESGQAKIDNE